MILVSAADQRRSFAGPRSEITGVSVDSTIGKTIRGVKAERGRAGIDSVSNVGNGPTNKMTEARISDIAAIANPAADHRAVGGSHVDWYSPESRPAHEA
jgi:hypothetical protein